MQFCLRSEERPPLLYVLACANTKTQHTHTHTLTLSRIIMLRLGHSSSRFYDSPCFLDFPLFTAKSSRGEVEGEEVGKMAKGPKGQKEVTVRLRPYRNWRNGWTNGHEVFRLQCGMQHERRLVFFFFFSHILNRGCFATVIGWCLCLSDVRYRPVEVDNVLSVATNGLTFPPSQVQAPTNPLRNGSINRTQTFSSEDPRHEQLAS